MKKLIIRFLIASLLINLFLLYKVYDQKNRYDRMVARHNQNEKFNEELQKIRDIESRISHFRYIYNLVYNEISDLIPDGDVRFGHIKDRAKAETFNGALEFKKEIMALSEESKELATLRNNVSNRYNHPGSYNPYAYIADLLKEYDARYNKHYSADLMTKLQYPNQGMDLTR